MKPPCDTLAIVTATLAPEVAADCFRSWLRHTVYHLPVYVVWSDLPPMAKETVRQTNERICVGTQAILNAFAPGVTIVNRTGGGVVPAFAEGVASAFADGADAVLCLHDDVELQHTDWDLMVLQQLDRGCKFAGFGGATGIGSAALYIEPYDPMQLARGGFVSNLRDAEAHGRRVRTLMECVCFDGFSQLGTKDWFESAWHTLVALGVLHHAYDGMLGCLAARAKVQPGLMIPVACHHYGGRTAVGNAVYQEWATAYRPGGDQGFWEQAHRIWYEEFRDVLPLRVGK